jgi:hypothetical protein
MPILATRKRRLVGSRFKASLGKNGSQDPISSNNRWVPVIPATWEA